MSLLKTLNDALGSVSGAVLGTYDATRGGRQVVTQEKNTTLRVSAICSAYENLFPQTNALVNEMITVEPYGIGANGARLAPARTPELNVLKEPNDDMSWIDFAGSMFRTWLTESELNVRVHKSKRGRVIGYSILPVGSRQPAGSNGHDYDTFQFYTTNHGMITLTDEEVITLRFSRSPRNIDVGVSPASATFVWSQIDDLFAQYQKAFFENGAVPATITFITANSRESYEEKRQKMEGGLKGARNRNKTIYVWRQFGDDGSSADEVEVKQIQGNNSTLAFGDLIKIINDKLNKAFGVSNFILGDDSSAKYDNAELSDYQFTRRQVYPALMSFWSQFQHGLDRVTGGLGYGISFSLDIPDLTERKKVKAEIAKTNVENLTTLISAGSGPSAAVQALGLGESWKAVADGLYRRVLSANAFTPDANDKRVGCACEHSQDTRIDASQLIGPSTTKDAEGEVVVPVWAEGDAGAKKIYEQLVQILEKLFGAETVEEILSNEQLGLDEAKKIIEEVLVSEGDAGAIASAVGVENIVKGNTKASISKELKNGGFHVSKTYKEKVANRTDTLVNRFADDARGIVREVLTSEAALSANEIRKKLKDFMPTSRAEMIARNETTYAFRAGRIENDKYIAEKYGLQIKLVWKALDGACDVCAAMDGQTVALGEAFPDEAEYVDKNGDSIKVHWDHSMWNDYGEVPDAHPNCRCYFDEEIVG